MRVVGPGFHEKVYRAVQRIPPGQVSTYGDIAALLGSSQVARHVGWALASLPDASSGRPYNNVSVPWHRVINAKGTISAQDNPLRGSEQYKRLVAEGVSITANGKIDLQNLRAKLI